MEPFLSLPEVTISLAAGGVSLLHTVRFFRYILVAIIVWMKFSTSLNTTRKRCTGLASPALGSMVFICTHCSTGLSTKQPLGPKMLLRRESQYLQFRLRGHIPDSSLGNGLFCHSVCCGAVYGGLIGALAFKVRADSTRRRDVIN
jgi:hypothetical protein